jgi:uncharacterized phage protein (TIGR02218 family)
MTFAQFEESIESSQPIEVFRFFLGAETFEYTPSEDQQVVETVTYDPEPMIRSKISQSPEDRENLVIFTTDGENEFARRYIAVVPGSRARIVVKRVQRPDFPGPEVITLYEGFVVSVKFEEDGHIARIATQPISSATSRSIPRFTYQGLCNHVLYDSGCKVDDTDTTFRLSGTVLTVVDETITVQGADGEVDGFWTQGFVEAQGGADARLILSHTGTSLQLLLPFPFDLVGETVVVLAGCDHTIATCDTKFFTPEVVTSNVINYGGFFFVPNRNIFENGLI